MNTKEVFVLLALLACFGSSANGKPLTPTPHSYKVAHMIHTHMYMQDLH